MQTNSMSHDNKLSSSDERIPHDAIESQGLQQQLAERIARADRLGEELADARIALASERAALSRAQELSVRREERLQAVSEEVDARRNEAAAYAKELASLADKVARAEKQRQVEEARASLALEEAALQKSQAAAARKASDNLTSELALLRTGQRASPPVDQATTVAGSPQLRPGGRRTLKSRLKRFMKRVRPLNTGGPRLSPPKDDRQAASMILASGLFDPDWYLAKYADVREAGVAPLEHFLHHGGSEGRSPGPQFDTAWYVRQDARIKASGLNPLVHFLVEGRSRGYKPSASDGPVSMDRRTDVMDLLSSPLFDAEWYRTQIAGLPKGRHYPAAHYLDHGWKEKKSPSPQFDGQAYLAQNADVEEAGVNPLLHFIRHGRSEGRKITPLSGASALPANQDPAPTTTDHEPAEPSSVMRPWVWRPLSEIEPANLMRLDGESVGKLPSDARLAERAQAMLETFKALNAPGGARTGVANLSLGASPLVGDAWFVTRCDFRLRLAPSGRQGAALRAFQWSHADNCPRLISEQSVTGGLIAIADVCLINPYCPLLLVLDDGEGEWIDACVVPYPSLARNGDHHAELAAASDTLFSLGWRLAGQHLASVQPGGMISSITIDMAGALGGERVLTQAFSHWAQHVLGVSITAKGERPKENGIQPPAASPALAPATRANGYALELGVNHLPTITALVSPPSNRRAVLIADAIRGKPRWLISLGDLELPAAAQPAHGLSVFASLSPALKRVDQAAKPASATSALTIRFEENAACEDASLLFPISPDAPAPLFSSLPIEGPQAVSAIVTMTDDADLDSLRATLESIRSQKGVDVRLILAGASLKSGAHDMCRALFSDCVAVEPNGLIADTINRAVAEATTPLLLILEVGMVLHDARTLSALCGLASLDKVGSASCATVQAAETRGGQSLRNFSAGVFPSQISFAGTPTLSFSEPRVASALPLSTFTVAANRRRLVVTKRSTWESCGGFKTDGVRPGDEDIGFGLRVIENGDMNICTTAVTVLAPEEKVFGNSLDPVYQDDSSLIDWTRLLAKLSFLKSLS